MGRTFEDPDGGGVIVDSSRGSQSGGDNGRRWDEVVGEAVVEVALERSRGGENVSRLSFSSTVSERCGRRTCNSKTSCTPSNSFSYLDSHPKRSRSANCPFAKSASRCSGYCSVLRCWGMYLALNSSNVSSPCGESPLLLLTLVLNVFARL